jgi:PAS domain S-box-containing protein
MTLRVDRRSQVESLSPAQCRRALEDAEERCARLEADRIRLEAILEGSRDAIWSWNTEGVVVRWNAAAEKLLGFEADEIVGQSLLKLIRPERCEAARAIIAAVRKGAWYERHETVRVRKDGSLIDVELTVSPVCDAEGRIVGGSTVCRPIAERKQFEASLSKRMSELTSLFQFTERLHGANSLDAVYSAALDAIEDALGCDRTSVLLFDAAGVMRFVAWRGLSDAYRKAVDGHSPWKRDARNPAPICIGDIDLADKPDSLKKTIKAEGIRALAFIPLFADGRLIGKFMTYYREAHSFSDDEMSLANTVARQLALAVVHQSAAEELRQSERRFRLMSEHAPVMIWMSDAHNHCLHLNRMLRRFWGVAEGDIPTFDWRTTMHPEDRERIGQSMIEAVKARAPVEVKGRYLDATGVYRVLRTNAQPRFSAKGEFAGMIGVNVDVTEREEAEAERELLIAELNHRVKNTLSVVQSIAHQTFREPETAPDARKAFEGRLVALALAHNQLTQLNWEHVSLERIAKVILKQSEDGSGRIRVSGPPVLLPPKEALSITMALHELCTNAMKYGALSNEAGRVDVEWSRSAGPRLRLTWRERGGPTVLPPQRRGFGSRLLERSLALDLDGEVQLSFEPSGLVCLIDAPLSTDTGGRQ